MDHVAGAVLLLVQRIFGLRRLESEMVSPAAAKTRIMSKIHWQLEMPADRYALALRRLAANWVRCWQLK